MSTQIFDLFDAFCELAGLASVQPESDGEGVWLVRVHLNEIEVELICETAGADRLYSRVVFGPMLSDADDCVQWGDLLEANFLLLDAAGPVFSRDLQNQGVVLQQHWPEGTQPHMLFKALAQQCDVAHGWRSGTLHAPALLNEGMHFNPAHMA